MKYIFNILWFAAFSMTFVSASAQRPPFTIKHYSVEDGLSQGSMRAVVQDHVGYVWVGTNDGLNRFDGVDFTIFRQQHNDPHSLSNNVITCLYEDHDSILWIGTQQGLNTFDRSTNRFTRIPLVQNDTLNSTDYAVNAIYEARDGATTKLWVCAPMLCVFDRQHQRLNPVNHQSQDRSAALIGIVNTICQDRQGNLWMGNDTAFFHFDPTTGIVDHSMNVQCRVTSLLNSRHGTEKVLWVGTAKGLWRYDQQSQHFTQLNRISITCITEDNAGRLWVGTDGSGLQMLFFENDGASAEIFRHEDALIHSLTNDYILSLYEDVTGGFWIGTYNGLNYINEFSPNFIVYRHHPGDSNSLGHDFVMPIIESRGGDIWFGTFGGGISVLRQQQGEHFEHFTHLPANPKSLCGNNIRSSLQDKTGTIWVGTESGLALYDSAYKTFENIAHLPQEDSVRFWAESLCEGRDGSIWAGAQGFGLIRIQRQTDVLSATRSDVIRMNKFKFTEFPLARRNPDESSEVYTMLEDRLGNIWAGTEVGLVKFDPETGKHTRYVHNPDDSSSLSDNNVWSIYEDTSEGIPLLWIGTSDGLNRFDVRTGKSHSYLVQSGFPNSFVYGILRDGLGRLWLSTNHGLTRFDDRQPEGMKFKTYDVSDGIQGNEFNRRSCCRLRDGEFLFGGTHGVTRFDPMQIRDNPSLPPVVLTNFTLFGKKTQFNRDLARLEVIELQHDEDVFSFEFAALSYNNAKENQYAYMMEGFDRDWNYCGTRRYANYTHLDPGTYVFKVKGSNNDGLWNDRGAAIGVVILPPFWKTWWFRSLTLLLGIVTIATAYRSRIAKLKHAELLQRQFADQLLESQEQERSRIAGELHDSLVQNLLVAKNRSLIGLKKLNDPIIVQREFDEISSVMTRSIDEVREIAHNLRPYQLDRLGLTKALRSLIDTLRESSGIQFMLQLDIVDEDFPGEQGILFYRIIQEAANNILKHSQASEASIIVKKDDSSVELTVKDNGRGFLVEENSTHDFGLSGIRHRVGILNGTLIIDSAEFHGTVLTIRIPLQRSK
jgi:two-component system sensor histidine kinase ChiS